MSNIRFPSSYNNIMNKYVLFAIIFIICTLLSLQGFDITDKGEQFTNQYQLLKYPLHSVHFNPMFILSDAAGGFWLHLFGTPNYFWGMIGGAVLFSLCAFVVASILETYFPKREVFISVLISSLFLTSFCSSYINRYTFAALLTLIFLWAFHKFLSEPHDSKNFCIYAFILGFLFIPIILSRFTLVMLIVVVPLIAAYCWWTTKWPWPLHGLMKGLFFVIMGVALATGVALYVFSSLEILDVYIDIIKTQLTSSFVGEVDKSFTSTHSMSNLVFLYVYQYIHTIIALFIFIGGVLIVGRIEEKNNRQWIFPILIFFAVFVIALGIALPQTSYYNFLLSYGIPKLFIGIIILFTLLILYFKDATHVNLALLVLVACTLMIINPFGSNTGIIKSTQAFWLILPLSLLSIQHLGKKVDNKFIKTLSSLVPTILIIMLIFAIFFHATNVYRDDPNRLNLVTPFNSPELKGTYSNSERVRVTDELIGVIKRETEPGDYVLMVNSMPMFYYLTETRPALLNPWVLQYTKERIVALEEERVEKEMHEVVLFIYSKVNTRDIYWPRSTKAINDADEEKLNYLKGQYIDTYQYSLIWENDAFAVYRIPR